MSSVAPFENPLDLYRSLLTSWSASTASLGESWSPDNPAKNHCSVTALIVQDVFGGDILKTRTSGGTHFYNSIEGTRWDLTMSQFADPIAFEDVPSSREAALADCGLENYRQLAAKLGLTVD